MSDAGYNFRSFTIPPHMLVALRRYVNERQRPGSFLQAVICNDLLLACGLADDDNLRNLPAFTGWLYNEAPSACWKSRENMEAWILEGDEQRAALAELHDQAAEARRQLERARCRT
ncbi:MAG: hypothetical protein IPN24_11290 [Betaproteobacteria bacterium]|nr:hypothetical protein [Betaproteobacteria bacterium]